ncbi:MAG: hypothetical protein ACT4NY_32120 [Pseudonocardiales bacterium]
MGGKACSQKQERELLVRSLRGAGSSWVEVVEALRQSYRLNPRVAFRYARGWSQSEAADEWNKRWPNQTKTFKSFSHWESWPGASGHAPNRDNISKLAELYECSVGDLLADLPNFRHLDTAGAAKPDSDKKRLVLPDGGTLDSGTGGSTQDDRDAEEALSPLLLTQEPALLVRRLQQVNFTELVQVILMWVQRLDPSVNRRVLLGKLSSALALAAVSPLLDALTPDEYEPVARFMQHPDTFDLPALTHAERMIINLRRQSDVLGPQLTLHSAIGYRQLAHRLAKAAPDTSQSHAISVYAELTQFLGWLCVSMGDYPSAQRYYDEARSDAHDAQNAELVTFILCAMSQLAKLQGKPRVAIDHAAAAAVWAKQARSPLAEAYAADKAVRAYVADNQPDRYREALDQEYAALQAARTDQPRASWWYFYNESYYWSTASRCALKLQHPEAALKAVDQSLILVDPDNLHDRIVRMLFRAKVRIQQEEIAEACSIVVEVSRLTASNASRLIVQDVSKVRGLLTPWKRTKAVRELDECLAAYRPAGGSGNGNGSTKRTYSG